MRTSCDCGDAGSARAQPVRTRWVATRPQLLPSALTAAGGEVGSWARVVRLAAAEEGIDSEADGVDEVSGPGLRAANACTSRRIRCPGRARDTARRWRQSPARGGVALAKPLTGAGPAPSASADSADRKVGHRPEQRLHADDEGLDQRLVSARRLTASVGVISTPPPDYRLVLVDVLLAVLLLILGTLLIRRLLLVDRRRRPWRLSSRGPYPCSGRLLAGILLSSSAALEASRQVLGAATIPAAASSRPGPRPAPFAARVSAASAAWAQRLNLRPDPELRHRGVEDADEVRPRLLRLRRVVPPAKDASRGGASAARTSSGSTAERVILDRLNT